MTVFILPTAGKAGYRGKYPTRARSVGASRVGGRHVELNDGTRLWSIDDRSPEFNAAGRYDDYAAILARAVAMTAEQYTELQHAAELDRSIIGIAGNTRRESIREQARAIRLAIKAATGETTRRDNSEYHEGRNAKPGDSNPYTDFPNIPDCRFARWALGRSEAPAAPAVCTIDCTSTWSEILPSLLALIENSTAEGRKIALEELTRMAGLADNLVTYQSKRDDESARAVRAEALAASRLAEASAARIKIMELEAIAQRSADCKASDFATVRDLRAAFPHVRRESI